MKIALTGASGFIGYKLTHVLLERGHSLKVLFHKTPPLLHKNIAAIQGGLDDVVALQSLVQDVDVVIHCAALVAALSEKDFVRVNVEGTKNLATAAQDAGVLKFLFLSSMAAREPHLSLYAKSKSQAEDLLAKFPGLTWDAFRPPGVYGPGDLQVLSLFKALKSGIALVPAGKDGRLSVIHVDDLVQAIAYWAEHVAPSKSIYEIAGPAEDDMRWEDLHNIVAKEFGVTPKFIQPPKAVLMIYGALAQMLGRFRGRAEFISPGKVRELCHSDWTVHDRAFEAKTDWRANIMFRDGVKQTLAWYREKKYL